MTKILLTFTFITIGLYADFYDKEPKLAEQNCKVVCEKCGFYGEQTGDYYERLKASNDSNDSFYDGMEHWIDYLYNTMEYLDANKIDSNFYVFSVEKCPILTFETDSLEISKIDSPFIFILYQKGKSPYIIKDITMSEYEINAYFGITNPKYPKESE